MLGGDNPPHTSGASTGSHDKQLCDLLECLLGPNALGRFLSEHNVDPNAVRGGNRESTGGDDSSSQSSTFPALLGLETVVGGVTGQLLTSDVASLLADILSGAQPIPSALSEEPRSSMPSRKHKS